jgi:hypothetical protein
MWQSGSGLNAPTISQVAELMHFQALKLANLQGTHPLTGALAAYSPHKQICDKYFVFSVF